MSGSVRGLANSWLPGCDEEVKREAVSDGGNYGLWGLM